MITRIGLISDTHGLLRPEAVVRLQDVDIILHAGDIGSDNILDDLKSIAPVTAVRGNIDVKGAAAALPEIESFQIAGQSVYMLHNLNDLKIDPAATGVNLVISGHSHQPELSRKDGVMYINPGSIGPRRFRLPVSMACLTLADDISAEMIELTV